jgi:23S rRNA pseudouridine1911/1915/1917 synthase
MTLKQPQQFTVGEATTLLPFLQSQHPGKSRSFVKNLLTRGQVQVAGKTVTHHAAPLRPGQTVTILTGPVPAGATLPFPVLYEDAELVVIDKPAGLLSMAAGEERERTAYHLVTDYVKAKSPGGRVFIVHRLDRDTSGVLLFAKNPEMKRLLQENWEELVTLRGYWAVVEGVPQEAEGRMVSWLRQTKTLLVYSGRGPGDGKRAVTNYKTIQTNGTCSLLEVSLETGRKNQIRVHMKDLGTPVAGDKKYGARSNPLGRVGLHAGELIVKHPRTGLPLALRAKPPGSFQTVTAPK